MKHLTHTSEWLAVDTELSTSGKHPKNSRIRVNPDLWLIPESLIGNTLKNDDRNDTTFRLLPTINKHYSIITECCAFTLEFVCSFQCSVIDIRGRNSHWIKPFMNCYPCISCSWILSPLKWPSVVSITRFRCRLGNWTNSCPEEKILEASSKCMKRLVIVFFYLLI